VIIAITILAALTVSPMIEDPVLPTWVDLSLEPANDAYQKILDEVRPAFGKDGFIDIPKVYSEFEESAEAYLASPDDSLLLMRALSWMEVLSSDFRGDSARFDGPIVGRFFAQLNQYVTPIPSFAFVRTRAIFSSESGTDKSFTHFRVLEKLYQKSPGDTELELAYLKWASLRPAADRDALVKLAQKQENLQFRNATRQMDLWMVYHSLAHKPPRRRDLLDKSYELWARFFQLLPEGHPLNTRDKRREEAGYIKETYDRWASWEGR